MWHPFAKNLGELGDTGDRVSRFRALALVCEAQDPKGWDTDVRNVIVALIKKGKDTKILNASELVELEALILRVSPDFILAEWRKYIENDYRVLFGAAPPASTTSDPAGNRASVIALAGNVQRLRTVRRSLGLMRSIVCICMLAVAAAYFFFGARYLGLLNGRDDGRPLTAVVVMAGALAGLISGTSRLYSLEWSGDVLLSTQSVPLLGLGVCLNLLLSVLEGGVFALILYVIFAGGILQGSLFPAFKFDTSSGATWSSFVDGGPITGVDFAKAIIWAFVAGFSERLVPDLLGQLAGSATASNVKSEENTSRAK